MQVHAGQTTSARNSTRHSQAFTVERCAEMLAFWNCLLFCSCLHLSRHAITHSIWSTIRSRCHNPTLVCCTLLGNYLYHPHNARISYSTSTLAAHWAIWRRITHTIHVISSNARRNRTPFSRSSPSLFMGGVKGRRVMTGAALTPISLRLMYELIRFYLGLKVEFIT